MKATVSKERKRKMRKRHKRADKGRLQNQYLTQRPAVAFFAALLAWALAFIAMRMPRAFITNGPITNHSMLILVSDAILGAIAFITAGIFLWLFQPKIIQRNSRIILVCCIVCVSAFYAALLLTAATWLPIPWNTAMPYFLPTVIAPILTTLLLGTPSGFATGMTVSAILAIYADRNIAIFLNGALVTALITYLAPQVRTRSKVTKLCLFAGLAQVPALAIIVLQTQITTFRFDLFAAQLLAPIISALVAALLALILLPLLEHIFNITTNISLLEFSDLGHPLLQRLALEAPGTYHHSLVVANIAQSAAEAIGANGLEARISAYFHDIGKLTKPEFFAENMFNRENPHDQLNPNMSTLIITSHVKEGLSIAQLYKLPSCVHRAIQEHHGTTVLQCFHHKAVTSQQELALRDASNRPLDDSQFRYPGPKPSTSISAIICLADAVEAASRCIAKPTPANLEDLVDDIVRQRLDDGQLDQCELSLLELSKVKRAFVFTLANMLHGRVAYPNHHENTNNKSAETDFNPTISTSESDFATTLTRASA